MDHATVEFPEFLEHGFLFLRAEIIHAGEEEMFVLFLDMAGVECRQVDKMPLNVLQGIALSMEKARFGFHQALGHPSGLHMFVKEFLHDAAMFQRQGLPGQFSEEDVFLLAMVGTVGIGADEIDRGIDQDPVDGEFGTDFMKLGFLGLDQAFD